MARRVRSADEEEEERAERWNDDDDAAAAADIYRGYNTSIIVTRCKMF